MRKKKLTVKKHNFALAYLETGNATESYRRAYDTSRMLATTISSRACELLKDSEVAAMVSSLQQQAAEAAVLDRAGTLKLITQLATADASDLMELQVRNCRHCWGVGNRKQWKNETEYAFACAEVMDRNAATYAAWQKDVDIGSQRPKPDDEPLPSDAGGYGFDVFASPNPECPHCLGEGIEHVHFKDTRKLRGAAKRLFAGVKRTKDGLEIKTRDQDKALDMLAKHHKIVGPEVQTAVALQTNVDARTQTVTINADPLDAARQYQELMKG
jgi:phage terminase small subunit